MDGFVSVSMDGVRIDGFGGEGKAREKVKGKRRGNLCAEWEEKNNDEYLAANKRDLVWSFNTLTTQKTKEKTSFTTPRRLKYFPRHLEYHQE